MTAHGFLAKLAKYVHKDENNSDFTFHANIHVFGKSQTTRTPHPPSPRLYSITMDYRVSFFDLWKGRSLN